MPPKASWLREPPHRRRDSRSPPAARRSSRRVEHVRVTAPCCNRFRVRGDRRLAHPVVAADAGSARSRTAASRVAAAAPGRPERRRDFDRVERRERRSACHRQSQRHVELVAVRLAETADVEAGDRRAHGAVDLDRRHAQERGLARIDAQVEVGALPSAAGCRRRACPVSLRSPPRTRAASSRSWSRSGPWTPTSIGASIGGPFWYGVDQDPRAWVLARRSRASRSSSSGVRRGS